MDKRPTTTKDATTTIRVVPESLRKMRERVLKAMEGGGAARVEAQKAKGKSRLANASIISSMKAVFRSSTSSLRLTAGISASRTSIYQATES